MTNKIDGGNTMRYKTMQTLEISEVKPEGWLKKQLEIQKEGLSGKLFGSWESVGRYSGWLGGTGENWERGPYFLDGILPLSYLLEDRELYDTAEQFIKWTLESQDEEGNFGPEASKHDWWSRTVMLKVLIQYYEITKKEAVLDFMETYYRFQLKRLPERPLKEWGEARAADLLYCIKWLHERRERDYLIELAELVQEQSKDWNALFSNLPFTRPTEFYYEWKDMELFSKDKITEFMQFHATHIVNVTMAFKYPALTAWLTGEHKDGKQQEAAIKTLMKYHGVATGAINGDEHLAGSSPSRGTELCAVAEYMFSLQIILEIFGAPQYADLLERLAYNAYPAMFTEDYMGHQYLEQVNQVAATNEKRNWFNNLEDSNTYGLEPNFGCCTANMHQAWPKFLKSLWYKEKDWLVSMVLAPNTLITQIGGEEICIVTETNYPADLTVRYVVKKAGAKLKMKLRIPGWCKGYQLSCNGKCIEVQEECRFIKIEREVRAGDCFEITFVSDITLSTWHRGSIAVERGPFVYALDMEEEWNIYREKGGICDYEVTSQDPWNYALMTNEKIEVAQIQKDAFPFSKENPPSVLIAKVRKVTGWELEDGSAQDVPQSPIDTQEAKEIIRLIPFGCTHLRIAQFPYCLD